MKETTQAAAMAIQMPAVTATWQAAAAAATRKAAAVATATPVAAVLGRGLEEVVVLLGAAAALMGLAMHPQHRLQGHLLLQRLIYLLLLLGLSKNLQAAAVAVVRLAHRV
jgi:hypothetical protein